MEFTTQLRHTTVHELLPGCHVESRKGTQKRAMQYVMKGKQSKAEWKAQGPDGPNWGKDADYIETGKPREQGKRSDIHEFIETVEGGERSRKRLRREHPLTMAKYPQFCEAILADNQPVEAFPDFEPRDWQVPILDVIQGPVDPRKIHFIVDEKGNSGKSYLTRYIEATFDDVQVMKPGKYADMAYMYDEDTKIFLLDCPRFRTDCIRYDFLEDIKDLRLSSTKYQSRMKRIQPAHVLVFMNEMPQDGCVSADRPVIHDTLNFDELFFLDVMN